MGCSSKIQVYLLDDWTIPPYSSYVLSLLTSDTLQKSWMLAMCSLFFQDNAKHEPILTSLTHFVQALSRNRKMKAAKAVTKTLQTLSCTRLSVPCPILFCLLKVCVIFAFKQTSWPAITMIVLTLVSPLCRHNSESIRGPVTPSDHHWPNSPGRKSLSSSERGTEDNIFFECLEGYPGCWDTKPTLLQQEQDCSKRHVCLLLQVICIRIQIQSAHASSSSWLIVA